MANWTKANLRTQFNRAAANGWIGAFATAAQKNNLPIEVLIAIASRESNIVNKRGDFRKGRYNGALWALYVFPVFATANRINSFVANTVFATQFRNAHTGLQPQQNLTDFYFRKYRSVNALSPCGCRRSSVSCTCQTFGSAPLLITVSNVVRVCAKEQMGWINARRIVACMADQVINRVNSVVKFVGHAMRFEHPRADLKRPVATDVFCGKPLPALAVRWLAYLRSKANDFSSGQFWQRTVGERARLTSSGFRPSYVLNIIPCPLDGLCLTASFTVEHSSIRATLIPIKFRNRFQRVAPCAVLLRYDFLSHAAQSPVLKGVVRLVRVVSTLVRAVLYFSRKEAIYA